MKIIFSDFPLVSSQAAEPFEYAEMFPPTVHRGQADQHGSCDGPPSMLPR